MLTRETAVRRTADDTQSTSSLARGLADEQQVRTTRLKVIQRLETVDVWPGFGQGEKGELGHGVFVVGRIRDQLPHQPGPRFTHHTHAPGNERG